MPGDRRINVGRCLCRRWTLGREGEGVLVERGGEGGDRGKPGITRRHFGPRGDLSSSYATRKLVTHDCPVIYALLQRPDVRELAKGRLTERNVRSPHASSASPPHGRLQPMEICRARRTMRVSPAVMKYARTADKSW